MLTVTSPPLKGAGGMFNLQTFSYILTIASPPLKEVRELAQRSMWIGGGCLLIINDLQSKNLLNPVAKI